MNLNHSIFVSIFSLTYLTKNSAGWTLGGAVGSFPLCDSLQNNSRHADFKLEILF